MEAKIVSQLRFSRRLFISSLGLFSFLLSNRIAIQPLGAASAELSAPEGAGLEETVSPASKTALRDLVSSQRELSPFQGLESLRRVTHRARPGETLAKLLSGFGLSAKERQMWLRSIQKHHPIKELHTGKEIHFYFAKNDPSFRGQKSKERLNALEIELNEHWALAWEKGNKGIIFSKRERPYEVELKTVGGVLDRPLLEDGARFGLNESLLSQLADIFSWDIDFNREMQKGDTFKILYEQRSRKRNSTKASLASLRILAAELINSGQKFFAIYFEKERGNGNYYDLEGRSLARAFLRFPLEFADITSYFSHSRFHPILKVERPHNGVDFAAKRGTPIRAVGDGRIVHAGRGKGGYGRMVEIQHDSVYASRYAHLQGLARGIRKGMGVKKGRIIGYVGCSGLCTGPHLHFELYRGQHYVDPLKFESPPEDRIEPAVHRVFENLKQLFLAELAATPNS
jgi:murein DD-endopeptidase MepM/ murein hydrolase activator NlpD